MSLNDRFKRSILVQPQAPAASVVRVDGKAELSTLLEDTLSIFQTEILKLKVRANQSVTGTLSPTEAKVLQGYAKTLVDMAKEVRAREEVAEQELGKMSDEELLTQTEAAAAAIRERMRKPTKS